MGVRRLATSLLGKATKMVWELIVNRNKVSLAISRVWLLWYTMRCNLFQDSAAFQMLFFSAMNFIFTYVVVPTTRRIVLIFVCTMLVHPFPWSTFWSSTTLMVGVFFLVCVWFVLWLLGLWLVRFLEGFPHRYAPSGEPRPNLLWRRRCLLPPWEREVSPLEIVTAGATLKRYGGEIGDDIFSNNSPISTVLTAFGYLNSAGLNDFNSPLQRKQVPVVVGGLYSELLVPLPIDDSFFALLMHRGVTQKQVPAAAPRTDFEYSLSYVQHRPEEQWKLYGSVKRDLMYVAERRGKVWMDRLAAHQLPDGDRDWARFGLVPYISRRVLCVVPVLGEIVSPYSPDVTEFSNKQARLLHELVSRGERIRNDIDSGWHQCPNESLQAAIRSTGVGPVHLTLVLGLGITTSSAFIAKFLPGVRMNPFSSFPTLPAGVPVADMAALMRAWPLAERTVAYECGGLYLTPISDMLLAQTLLYASMGLHQSETTEFRQALYDVCLSFRGCWSTEGGLSTSGQLAGELLCFSNKFHDMQGKTKRASPFNAAVAALGGCMAYWAASSFCEQDKLDAYLGLRIHAWREKKSDSDLAAELFLLAEGNDTGTQIKSTARAYPRRISDDSIMIVAGEGMCVSLAMDWLQRLRPECRPARLIEAVRSGWQCLGAGVLPIKVDITRAVPSLESLYVAIGAQARGEYFWSLGASKMTQCRFVARRFALFARTHGHCCEVSALLVKGNVALHEFGRWSVPLPVEASVTVESLKDHRQISTTFLECDSAYGCPEGVDVEYRHLLALAGISHVDTVVSNRLLLDVLDGKASTPCFTLGWSSKLCEQEIAWVTPSEMYQKRALPSTLRWNACFA